MKKSQLDMSKFMLTLNLQLARLVFQMSLFQSDAGHTTAVEPLLQRALELQVGDALLVNR